METYPSFTKLIRNADVLGTPQTCNWHIKWGWSCEEGTWEASWLEVPVGWEIPYLTCSWHLNMSHLVGDQACPLSARSMVSGRIALQYFRRINPPKHIWQNPQRMWAPPFLQEAYHTSPTQLSYSTLSLNSQEKKVLVPETNSGLQAFTPFK